MGILSSLQAPASVDVGSAAKEQSYLDGVMSVADTAKFLGASRRTIWNMMDRGELPWTKIGNCRKISKKFLVKLLAYNHHGPL